MSQHENESPWAIAVDLVSSRTGLSKDIDSDYPVPSGIGDEVVHVTEGKPVHLTARIDSLVDGLLLTGTLDAPLSAECTRCLTPLHRTDHINITAFYPYDADPKSHDFTGDVEVIAGEDEGGDTYALSAGGRFMDIEDVLRDTLVEAMPLQPLCRPDCAGLCPQCGINLNEHPEHEHTVTDMRWSALEQLRDALARNEEE